MKVAIVERKLFGRTIGETMLQLRSASKGEDFTFSKCLE
jgi:hypothetical protein